MSVDRQGTRRGQRKAKGGSSKPDSGDPIAEWDRQREKEWQQYKNWLDSNRGKLDNRHPTTWSPWLLIRYALGDLGFPRPILPGTVFWASPDIWVESSDPLGRPVANEDNYIHTRISNLGGADAAPVKVDFYWADPSLGLGPGTMHHIVSPDGDPSHRSVWVEVFSKGVVDVRCPWPWIPSYVNAGHECLVVECDNHILDPLSFSRQPTLDRHVAQRNVAVLQASAGETVTFSINVNNLFPMATQTIISTRMQYLGITDAARRELEPHELIPVLAEFGGRIPTAQEMPHLFRTGTDEHRLAVQTARMVASRANAAHRFVRAMDDQGAASISTRLSETASFRRVDHSGSELANLLLARDKFNRIAQCSSFEGEIELHNVLLKPFEQRSLEVEMRMPTGARPGEFAVFHLMQQAEGYPIGGYTVIIEHGRR